MSRQTIAPAGVRLAVSLLAGGAVAATVAFLAPWEVSPAAGWGATACVYVGWVWIAVAGFDAVDTAAHATDEDPGRAVTDALLLTASIASLVAVGLILFKAGDSRGAARVTLVGSSVASVALSWALVHTLFALRYARMYYGGTPGGIDFNESAPPSYSDFAYMAFTIGMTFQVSDTALQSTKIRAAVLGHAMLSFLFGAVILATTINLVAGLSN